MLEVSPNALPAIQSLPEQEAATLAAQSLSLGNKKLFYALAHRYERRRLYRYLRKHYGYAFETIHPGVHAPPHLVVQTSAMNHQWLAREVDPDVYFLGGYHVTANWLKILEHIGFFPRNIGSMLELGCGSARILRHFRHLGGARIIGSDVNPAMIEWCKDNVPGIEFYQNQLQPPLDFAQDGSLDLVTALSVFTHIPLEWQQDWLREIYRVLRPGGVFLCTIHGAHHERVALSDDERAQLMQDGHLTLTSEDDQASLSTKVGGSRWDIFQTRAEVVRIFGSVFRIVDYIPGGLDLLVLEKPGPTPLTVAQPYPGVAFGSLD